MQRNGYFKSIYYTKQYSCMTTCVTICMENITIVWSVCNRSARCTFNHCSVGLYYARLESDRQGKAQERLFEISLPSVVVRNTLARVFRRFDLLSNRAIDSFQI